MTFAWDDPNGLVDRNGLKVCYAMLTAAMPVDLVIVVLGTNDMQKHFSATTEKIEESACKVMKRILTHEWAEAFNTKVLFVSPVSINNRAAVKVSEDISDESVVLSQQLSDPIERAAVKYGQYFANAAEWDVELSDDGIHYTQAGHVKFAENIH